VIVGNQAVENVQIREAPSFKMTGTIDWGDAAATLRAGIMLRSSDGRNAPTAPSSIDAGGTVTFPAVRPGQYLILPQAPAGLYPVSVVFNGQEVLGKPVDLLPGSTFRVSFKTANGSIRGTVDNCGGASVVLIPKSIQAIAFGRVAECRTDGTFEMSGVPPGDYAVAAFHVSTNPPTLMDPAQLENIPSKGTSVSVAQSAVTVQLSVNPSLE
jgi:hypothetical protein